MRYLGIDYGLKRIGIAVSDDDGRIAFPAGVILNHGFAGVLKEIIKRISTEHIEVIVIGLPIGVDNRDSKQTKMTRSFITLLKQSIATPVETENELFTSRMARVGTQKGKSIDASAAAIILQSYLDKQS